MVSKIYIPTLGRAIKDRQYTYKHLSQKYKDKVIFVIQESEKTADFFKDKNLLIVENGTGIAEKRKIIAYHAGACKFAMFDDDLSFYYKPDISLNKKEQCSDKILDYMFDLMSTWLDEVCCVGLGSTYTMYKLGKEIEDAFRVCLNVFYNGETLPKDELDWTSIKDAEDFYVLLQLLIKGYLNKISLKYLVSTNNGTSSAGGASLDRTIIRHNESMRLLKSKFPRYITLTYETIKTDKMGGSKAKALIQWKQVYTDAILLKRQKALFS
jgi:hypothetical protein